MIRGRVIAYEQLAHGNGRVAHPVGEAPLIVVPGQDAHQGAFDHLGLVHVEGRGIGVVVEVDGDIGLQGVAEDALELAAPPPP